MQRLRIVFDDAGMQEMLKSAEVAEAVNDLADLIGEAAYTNEDAIDHDVPVVVRSYETDRAAANVELAHPAGMAIEAKYGVLSAAVGSVGLTINQKAKKR